MGVEINTTLNLLRTIFVGGLLKGFENESDETAVKNVYTAKQMIISMNKLAILFYSFIILTVISIRFKIYLRVKITNPDKKLIWPWDRPNFTDFFPMSIKYRPPNEIRNRKIANVALVIFYLSILGCFMVTYLIRKYLRTT